MEKEPMSNLPKPDLATAVASLADRDEFRVLVAFIREERERFFADFRQAETSNDVMKITGSVAAMDELLQLLEAGN